MAVPTFPQLRIIPTVGDHREQREWAALTRTVSYSAPSMFPSSTPLPNDPAQQKGDAWTAPLLVSTVDTAGRRGSRRGERSD